VATAPQSLTLKTHRDRQNWWQSVWIRRVLLVVPTLLVVAALVNVFGQRPTTATATTARARLTVVAPAAGRSGLIYATRFRIDALEELKKATLLLDGGWADGYTVNGQTPQPVSEGSSNGKLTFDLGHVAAGRQVTFWLSLQINPTTIGRHRQNVSLYDGDQLVAVVHRSIRIFP
jgi:murein DD-endopeptidase MepM/ murein hydrolase activator NlpD